MPWDVRKQGDGTWCVFKKTDGSKVACHDSQAQARAQVRALYAAEADASSSLMDARELNLFVVAARERDVNIPGGGGHDLLNYWTRGPGAAKIVWGTDGSFARCVAQLGKYVKKPQGLCAEYHKAATGEWPAEKGVPSAGSVIELADGLLDYFDAETLEFAVSSQFATNAKSDAEDANLSAADAGDLNAAARRIAAERGWALPDGSYPIRDAEHHGLADLAKAVRAVGRGSRPHDEIRRHIIKRARALNAADQIPENWSATGKREEAALTTTHEFHDTHNQQDHDPTKGKSVVDKIKSPIGNKASTDKSTPKPSSTKKLDADEGPTRQQNIARMGELERKADSDDGLNSAETRELRLLRKRYGDFYDPSWDDYRDREDDGEDFTLIATAAGKKKKSCPPGQHMMPNGTCMDDDEMKNSKDMPMKPDMMEYADEPWEGVLVVEGSESGDGRLFALGSLDWAQLPLPLMYQPANVGGHSGSFAVGEITHVARRGNELYGWGNIFGSTLSGDHGEGIRNVMKVGGVSVDVDAVKDADVEMVYADDESGPNPFAKPETTIFHRGRVRGATLVAFPAFVEAKLRFTGALTAAASCGCGDAGELADEATELLVASVADDTTHTITIPNLPPPHWFTEPTDVEATGALTITDEGRIFAIVAPANVTHRSVKTKVPRNLDFSRFHKAETIVRGGDRVVTGVITANCGHAATENYGTLARRREHYDNSCSVLANVRVGYSRNGNIWAAGALNPGASAEQVAQALGCTLSLDVQPHPDRPGVREFIAAHLVPVPGFPLARTRPSATYSDGVLSAAALPVSYVDKPQPRRVDAAVTLEFVTRAKNAVATQLGFDATSRKRELARQLELT